MFGGCTNTVPGGDGEQPKLAETTMLQFGESMTSSALLVAVHAVVVHVIILAHIMCSSMRIDKVSCKQVRTHMHHAGHHNSDIQCYSSFHIPHSVLDVLHMT